MGCMQCFMWYRHFKSVRTFLEDDKRAVQSITVNVEKINQLVPEGCQIDNQQYCWCYWSAVWVHAGNPNVWIEHALSLSSLSLACWQLSRKNIVKVCQDHCQCVADDTSFMLRIISGHDSWVYGYDPETKQQLTQWKSPSSWPKKARQGHSSSKSMLTGFFFWFFNNIHSIVHWEFISQGQTVNWVFYCSILMHLREDVCESSWIYGVQRIILHDDNSPCHQALLTHEFLAKNNIVLLQHPPFSPDLAPVDFYLFSKLKIQLKSCHFNTLDKIQSKSQKILNSFMEKWFPGQILNVARILGPVYCCASWLLWRRYLH